MVQNNEHVDDSFYVTIQKAWDADLDADGIGQQTIGFKKKKKNFVGFLLVVLLSGRLPQI